MTQGFGLGWKELEVDRAGNKLKGERGNSPMLAQQRPWQEQYLDRFYRNRKGWVNGTAQFHELIRKYLPADKQVLELGPGTKSLTSGFLRSNYAVVDGVDVDETARQNPALRNLYICKEGSQWPIADESYDAVVSDFVLEHVASPMSTVSEAYRVLRPGGQFFFRTPNLWHYVSMVSWLSPHWFHNLVSNRLRNLPEDSLDPYPTCYRMNRCRTIKAIMRKVGFGKVELLTIEKNPSYGQSSRILFLLFMGYERVVNSAELFSTFRSNILGVFVKPLTAVGSVPEKLVRVV
jgi:SAM-dependent methyltransferase